MLLRIVGFSFLALTLAGLVLRVFFALQTGQAFYGVNYMGLLLGTYTTLSVLAAVLLAGIAAGLRWLVPALTRMGNRRKLSRRERGDRQQE